MAERSTVVGLVVPDVRNPFFVDLARGAEERARRAGLDVVLLDSHDEVDREAEHLAALEAQGVVGVVLTPVRGVPDGVEALRAAGVPVVLADWPDGRSGLSTVSVDDLLGGRLAAEHLIEGGRRRILFVGGPLGQPQITQRLTGARRAVKAVDDAHFHLLPVSQSSVVHGIDAGQDLLAFGRRIDAVLAANDLLALGVLQSLTGQVGAKVPVDVAIVGYDDIDIVASAVVPITSVRRPRNAMGAAAVGLLLEEIDGAAPGRAIVLAPELVVRESSAAVA